MASSENDRAGAPLTRRQLRERAMNQEAARSQAQPAAAAGPSNVPTPSSRREMRQHDLDHEVRASAAQPRPAAGQPAPARRPQNTQAAPRPQRPQAQAAQSGAPDAAPGRPVAAPQQPGVRPSAAPGQAYQPSPQRSSQQPVARQPTRQQPGGQQPGGQQSAPRQPSPRPVTAPPPQQRPSAQALPQRFVEPPSRAAQSMARAQELRAASEGRSVQPPVVAPPAVTGAVRRIDETGRLTPAVSVAADAIPVVEPEPRAPAAQPDAGPNRIGVRDAVAKARASTAPRVYPAGVTPFPAEPNQPSRLGMQPGGSVRARIPAPHQEAHPSAAGAPAAQGSPPPDPAVPAWSHTAAEVAAPQAESASVPSWDSVLGARPADLPGSEGGVFADAEPIGSAEELPAAPASDDSWLGYTPFHYVILVVIGLVLGFVCWQLLSASSDGGAQAAQAVFAVVQGAAPGSA